jgi:hypothetical protein
MRRKLAAAVFVLAIAACLRVTAHAQVDLFSLEAAYIFNFTAFTEWPPTRAASASLMVCASNKGELGAALAKLEGRQVAARTWHLRMLSEGSTAAGCDVLIVDGSPVTSTAIKSTLGTDSPLLIVRTPDAPEGPCVVLLVRQGDQLRFDIDNSEAARRHLGLSSKLLRLARNVT